MSTPASPRIAPQISFERVARNPSHVAVELTTRCNARCLQCAHHYERFGEDIDESLYETLEGALLPEAKRLELCGLGEPLLSPLFTRLVERYHDRPILLDTTTNGVLLRDEGLAAQLVRCHLLLSVSVDGACKETFERIRPPLRWEALLEGLDCVARECRDAGPEARFYFQLYFLAMRSNIRELPDVVRLAARFDARKVVVNILSGEHIYHEVRDEDPCREPAVLAECCLRAMEVGQEVGVEVDVPELFLRGAPPETRHDVERDGIAVAPGRVYQTVRAARPIDSSAAESETPNNREGEFRPAPVASPPSDGPRAPEWVSVVTGRRCDWPWTHTCIEVNGDVHPCYSYCESLGNLRERSWSDIWNGPAYRRFRRLIAGWNPNGVCRVCPFPFGITSGDQTAYDHYFDRFDRLEVPLDSADVEFGDGFHGLELSSEDSCHRWMSAHGSLALPVPSGAAFLRLRIFHRLPVPETNGGVCVVEGESPQPFDNSAPVLHFPVTAGPPRRITVKLFMEASHRVDGDERDLALGLCGIEWLIQRETGSDRRD